MLKPTTHRPQHTPLLLLLLTIFSLGLVVIAAVPWSVPDEEYNVDEYDHFMAVEQLTIAVRDSVARGQWPTPEEWLFFGGVEATRGSVYYWVQAVVQLLVPIQLGHFGRLVLARSVSLSLLIGSVALTYGAARKLFPTQPGVALVAAAMLGLSPTMLFIAVGVNLEVMSLLLGAAMLWVLTQLHDRLGAWWLYGVLTLLTLSSFLLKGTTWTLLAAPPIVFVLALPSRTQRWVWLAGVLLLPLGWLIFNPFTQSGAAYWYHYASFPYAPGRVLPETTAVADTGQQALAFPDTEPSEWIVQYVPRSAVDDLHGQTVTVQVRTRALSGSVTIAMPSVGPRPPSTPTPDIQLTETWQTISVNVRVPDDATEVGVFLSRALESATVLYDSVLLADVTCLAAASDLTTCNLLWNPSAEILWPQAEPDFGLPYKLNTRVVAVLHWQRTAQTWLTLPRWWFVSFWGSWNGVVPTLSRWQLLPLLLLTGLAAVGALWSVWQAWQPSPSPSEAHAQQFPWKVIFAFVLPSLAMIIYRADLLPQSETVFVWSGVRHAIPAFAALFVALAVGLQQITPTRWRTWGSAIVVLGLFLINIDIMLNLLLPYFDCVWATGPYVCSTPFR